MHLNFRERLERAEAYILDEFTIYRQLQSKATVGEEE